ncbi:MAG TPA: FG-GAP-like repeat-containing protein [Acidobacteriaceae bacterium]|nr:FG-GAP-like repeat-containing protein [Acidobacteriaceae bacterium]
MPSRKVARNLLILAAVAVTAAAMAAIQTNSPQKRPNPAEAARLNSIGIALMNQQLTQKAAAEFAEAEVADPTAAIPVLNRGIALLYEENLGQAEQELRRAAQRLPNDPRAWYNLGLVQMDEADQKRALADMQHVLALDPGDADTHYFAGQLEMSLGNLPEAMTEFRAALRINPSHASAEFGLARALQRSGEQQAAHEEVQKFQHLVNAKISSPLALGYGDRGHFSTMEEMALAPPPVGLMIPVKFEAEPVRGPPGSGGGACMMDVFAAGSQDLVAMGSDPQAIEVYRNLHDGSFEQVPASETGLDASGQGVACAVGDYDNDGKPDLAVVVRGADDRNRVFLYHNLGGGKFEDVTAKVGITQKNDPNGLTFVDFDHDGDLDLFVTGKAVGKSGPNVMWRNNGNSTFTDVTAQKGLTGHEATVQAELSDINNDRAVDLVVTCAADAPTIYLNQRENPFRPMRLYDDPSLPPTRGVAIFDFNKDGWMDVALTHAGEPGLTLWRNVGGTRFERVPLPLPRGVIGGWGVTPIDFDNDGWVDLAAVLETRHGTELHVFRNLGPKGWKDVSAELGLDKLHLRGARSVTAADLNGDGAADLIVTRLHGAPIVLRNVGGSQNHSLRLTLVGLADNKSGIGTKVSVLAGGQWQKFEVAGSSGYLGQNSLQVVAGLGQAKRVDVIRLLWPTGVPQDEIDADPGKPIVLHELDRRGSSCPVLFTWDGKQYRFISDVIGAAVVGHWVSPTATNRNDPGEWIRVPGDDLQPLHGMLSVRFGEPMEEVNYIDQLRLVAVDHPASIAVYPDEKFLSEPPFATGKAVAVSAPHPPAGAWDNEGQNVLPVLDGQQPGYLHDFHDLSYDGFANLHSLTLDLGPWTPAHPLRLLLHGYVDYFSASSMYAAWQAGLDPIPPCVEVLMPDGHWQRIINDMGFPAGLPRMIVVDLTGKLPPGVRKIRITTNLQIYWDRALVDNGPNEIAEVRQTEVPLATAHLAFRGYPEQIELKSPGDLTYDYNRISQTGPFLWARGMYTRYGDVTPLLRKIDNEYVIFGTGEEIDAEFRATGLPPLPPGWKRDYFFYANGFVKDMDFWEAEPYTVGELPFHGMSTYPYPANEHYPDTPAMQDYLLNWDTRFESGKKIQRWDFEYQPAKERPIQ